MPTNRSAADEPYTGKPRRSHDFLRRLNTSSVTAISSPLSPPHLAIPKQAATTRSRARRSGRTTAASSSALQHTGHFSPARCRPRKLSRRRSWARGRWAASRPTSRCAPRCSGPSLSPSLRFCTRDPSQRHPLPSDGTHPTIRPLPSASIVSRHGSIAPREEIEHSVEPLWQKVGASTTIHSAPKPLKTLNPKP